jgi:DNA-binding PadR family transcriptional regulator
MFGRGHTYRGNRISPMQLIILILLRDRPMYGYEVLKELRDRFDGVWVPQTGSIYPAIKRLEEHGLVAAEEREGTDYYHITDEGSSWVADEIRRSPRDVRLLARYLQIISRAIEADPDILPIVSGPFAEGFDGDSQDQAMRAKRLRAARTKIAEHLAMIDKELGELELEQGGKE